MISPVVLQGTIQRTQDYSQLKQNEDTKAEFDHTVINSNQQEKNIKKHESVVKQENTEKKQEHYDAKDQGNGTYFGHSGSGNNHKKSEDEGRVLVRTTGSFDVKA